MGEFLTFDEFLNWDEAAKHFTPPARLAVIGDPIAHSRSPQMHNPALRERGIEAQYIRVQVPQGRVAEAFKQFAASGFLGVNITIPHKFEALKAVDKIDPLARRLGAVNTLAIREGRLLGYNSDGPGFLRSVKESFGVGVEDLRVLILGAGGGAGRAVAVQSALVSCRELVLMNRTAAKAEALAAEVTSLCPQTAVKCTLWTDDTVMDVLPEIDLIVNATSIGMKGGDSRLLPAQALQARHRVFDMVYRADGETLLLADARKAGAKVVDGLTLLLHQGAISFEHWFGGSAPLEAMREGLRLAVQA